MTARHAPRPRPKRTCRSRKKQAPKKPVEPLDVGPLAAGARVTKIDDARSAPGKYKLTDEAKEYWGVVKPDKKRSASVYTNGHFVFITKNLDGKRTSDDKGRQVMCVHCANFKLSALAGPTNLKHHLVNSHADVPLDPERTTAPKGQPSMEQTADRIKEWRQSADELLLQVIAASGLTINAASSKALANNEKELEMDGASMLDDIARAVVDKASKRYGQGVEFDNFCKYISGGRYRPPSATTLVTKLKQLKDSLLASTKVILKAMGVEDVFTLATDVWSSKAGRSYYGIYLHAITIKWQLVGLPIGLTRLTGDDALVDVLVPGEKGQPARRVTSVKPGPTHTGEMLAEHSREALKSLGIEYTGCAGGDDCAFADPAHTTGATVHNAFANLSDSGGADPVAAALIACNALRCY